MHRPKLLNALFFVGFLLCLTLASSWYGALIYVRTYPNIVEYTIPMEFRDTKNAPIDVIKAGSPFILHGGVRRQPYSCWGSFTYGLKGAITTYQFQPTRSSGLQDKVHDYEIKHFMTVPNGLPPGRYRLMVTVYPTCEGVDIRPQTTDFDTWIDVIS